MRKVLLLSAAMALLLVGSVSLGVAVARTGAPVFYDARTHPGSVDALEVEAEGDSPAPGTGGGGATEAGEADGAGRLGGVDDDADRRSDGDTDATDRSPGDGRRSGGAPGGPTPTPTAPGPRTDDGQDGTATPAPPVASSPPPAPEPTAEEQEAWLSYQQLVRDCMTAAGHEYRHWKWWEEDSPDPNSLAPAMPDDLGDEAEAAWREALYGSESSEGCLVVAVEQDRESAATPSPDAGDAPDGDAPDAVAPDGETAEGADG